MPSEGGIPDPLPSPTHCSYFVSQLLELFLNGFKAELTAKVGKFDSDPHLWMPMTLGENEYVELMKQKGTCV